MIFSQFGDHVRERRSAIALNSRRGLQYRPSRPLRRAHDRTRLHEHSFLVLGRCWMVRRILLVGVYVLLLARRGWVGV